MNELASFQRRYVEVIGQVLSCACDPTTKTSHGDDDVIKVNRIFFITLDINLGSLAHSRYRI